MLAVLVGLHFLMTVIYVSPKHNFPGWANQVSQAYMAPVFHQAWELFAPNPPLQEKAMQFRIYSDGEWTDWMDPGVELLRQHDSWRLSNANIAYRMHQNAAYRLWRELYRLDIQHKPSVLGEIELKTLFSAHGYQVAKFYVLRQYEKLHPKVRPDSLRLRLVIHTPPIYPGRDGEWKSEMINLPADAAR